MAHKGLLVTLTLIAVERARTARFLRNQTKGSFQRGEGEETTPLVSHMRALYKSLDSRGSNSTVGSAAMPREVTYSPALCDDLFVYAESRDLCRKLQPRICGKQCGRIVPADSQTNCADLQETLCYVPKPGRTPEPLEVGAAPQGEPTVVVTVCNVFPASIGGAMWLAYEGRGTPKPIVTRLRYLDCSQVKGWSEMSLGVYVGAYRVGGRECGDKNEMMLVGQSGLDDAEAVIFAFSFHDEGMKRPVLCHAAPRGPAMTASVRGRTWYPFTGENLKGVIKYLECEVLALDNDDSLRNPEFLDLSNGGQVQTSIKIVGTRTLFLIDEDQNGAIGSKAFNLGHLKYK